MGLRRRYRLGSVPKKIQIGDLIVPNSSWTFPISLRGGPGYTFDLIDRFNPEEIGLVIEYKIGHGSAPWVRVVAFPRQGNGWIPVSVVKRVNDS